MKQQAFENEYADDWQAFDALCTDLEKLKTRRELSLEEHLSLPDEYRKICHHYALAQHRHYSPHLVAKLHAMVLRGHQLVYRGQGISVWSIIHFFAATFPQTVRAHHWHVWMALAVFVIPLVGMTVTTYHDETLVYSVLSSSDVQNYDDMYNPENSRLGRTEDRAASTDIQMLGHYINNNISIDFRTYASGLLAGIGPLFISVFNGIHMGAVAGYLTQAGYSSTFWSFVAGHSAFELMALVISAAAGFRLGQPLFAPGRRRRLDAFKESGRDSIKMLIGAAVMTFLAAFIEAFWSSKVSITPNIKYIVGIGFWLLTIAYLWRAGRYTSVTSDANQTVRTEKKRS